MKLQSLGRARGWPISLEFNPMVTYTVALKEKLLDLVHYEDYLCDCMVWNDFLDSINCKIHELGRTDSNDEDSVQFFEHTKLRAMLRRIVRFSTNYSISPVF